MAPGAIRLKSTACWKLGGAVELSKLAPLLPISQMRLCDFAEFGIKSRGGRICVISIELIGKFCPNGAADFYNYAVHLPCIDLHL